jgi:hypothetical protein
LLVIPLHLLKVLFENVRQKFLELLVEVRVILEEVEDFGDALVGVEGGVGSVEDALVAAVLIELLSHFVALIKHPLVTLVVAEVLVQEPIGFGRRSVDA